jgi:hypothetical protein
MRMVRILGAGAGLAAVLVPTAVEACAVCFGRTDSRLGEGMNWGVFTLLAAILTVLAGVAGFAVFLARRAAVHSRAEEETAAQVESS